MSKYSDGLVTEQMLFSRIMERFTDASFVSMSHKWGLLLPILCLSRHHLASLIHLKVIPEIKPKA